MTSIRDVAKMAQVAPCTVSRVINGSEAVSDKTRERILQVMKEMDFVPNELARGMFRQKAGIIAMLVPSIRHPFFSSLASRIENDLFEQGYKLMLCSTKDSPEREREYMKIFKSNIVDGVILGVSSLEKDVYEAFQKPLIMLDAAMGDHIPVVAANHGMGGRLAADRFVADGRHHIIHVCNEGETGVLSYESHRVLENALNARGIRTTAISVKWNDLDYEGYLELAKRILGDNPDIDGIMAADLPAIAFLKAAVRMGKRVPEEFGVVAYDGTYVVGTNLMDITTIVQPIKAISKKAVDLMMQMIDGVALKNCRYELDVELKMGETTLAE